MPNTNTMTEKKLHDIPFSILDLIPITEGNTIETVLKNSLRLVQHAEKLGYNRYWLAEHHNTESVASSATAVLIGYMAGGTHTIRVGSGGVMLPNHAPMVIAEQFGTLAALHPGRIDLGLGRAPGSDQLTAYALRRRMDPSGPDDFADQIAELSHFMRQDFPADHPFAAIRTTPAIPVPLYILGSSDYGARLAARLGLPYAFAHHFAGAGGNTGAALDLYRSQFRPSDVLAEPYPMIGVSALAADTEERARYEARAGALSMLLLRSGRLQEIPSPEQAAAYPYSPAELDLLRAMGRTEVVGSAEQVAAGLDELAQRYGVREMIISTRAYSLPAKLASMDLIARAYSRVGAAG